MPEMSYNDDALQKTSSMFADLKTLIVELEEQVKSSEKMVVRILNLLLTKKDVYLDAISDRHTSHLITSRLRNGS